MEPHSFVNGGGGRPDNVNNMTGEPKTGQVRYEVSPNLGKQGREESIKRIIQRGQFTKILPSSWTTKDETEDFLHM